MFDIIKDLKENIKKNNMKKLMLSAVLGMFCYCTNNAMEGNEEEEPQIEEIIDVLGNMILDQVNIFNAKEAIKKKGGKIYATIKDVNGKVTKGNLLDFIKKQFNIKQKEKFQKYIEDIEQYFHLEKIKEDEECTKNNLTEIFWEAQEVDEKIDEVEDDITDYLIEIATSEEIIRDCFQEYYEVKIKEGKEKQKEEIIDEIMNECRGETKTENLHNDFLANLGIICDCEQLKEIIGNKKDAILEAIQRRITLDEEITEDALKSFIRKKIGIEETKKVEPEEEKKNSTKSGKPAEEECCHCC